MFRISNQGDELMKWVEDTIYEFLSSDYFILSPGAMSSWKCWLLTTSVIVRSKMELSGEVPKCSKYWSIQLKPWQRVFLWEAVSRSSMIILIFSFTPGWSNTSLALPCAFLTTKRKFSFSSFLAFSTFLMNCYNKVNKRAEKTTMSLPPYHKKEQLIQDRSIEQKCMLIQEKLIH